MVPDIHDQSGNKDITDAESKKVVSLHAPLKEEYTSAKEMA